MPPNQHAKRWPTHRHPHPAVTTPPNQHSKRWLTHRHPRPDLEAEPARPGFSADDRTLLLRHLLELGLEVDHPLLEGGVGGGEDADREQAGVAGVADRHGRDRDARGHLDDREQGVHAVEVLQRDGYADHGQRGDRGEHAGQVGRSPGAGDDHGESAPGRLLAVGEHLLGHPVRGDDVGLVGDVELGQRLRGRLHHRPVGVRPHDDADPDLVHAHSLSLPRSPRNQAAACRARSRHSSRSSP